ncbi:hypothetical protein BLOT_009583 [Blomia tropicalis]|nr:hypothetical protein BLOT_009583 [Blomia tropicalis]
MAIILNKFKEIKKLTIPGIKAFDASAPSKLLPNCEPTTSVDEPVAVIALAVPSKLASFWLPSN